MFTIIKKKNSVLILVRLLLPNLGSVNVDTLEALTGSTSKASHSTMPTRQTIIYTFQVSFYIPGSNIIIWHFLRQLTLIMACQNIAPHLYLRSFFLS